MVELGVERWSMPLGTPLKLHQNEFASVDIYLSQDKVELVHFSSTLSG